MMLKTSEKDLDVKPLGMLGPSVTSRNLLEHIRMNVEEDEDDDDEEEADDEESYIGAGMKSRADSSPIEGGFWMAAVSAATGGGGNGPMESATSCPAASESGFISSQPSMAEFMLPHRMTATDDMQTDDGTQTSIYNASMQDSQQSGINVQEYPWMKEKKTSRKNNHQGECRFCGKFISCIYVR